MMKARNHKKLILNDSLKLEHEMLSEYIAGISHKGIERLNADIMGISKEQQWQDQGMVM